MGNVTTSSRSKDNGLFDYNDNNTINNPISISGGNQYYKLTNDTLGAYTNRAFAPDNIGDIWDPALNIFTFTSLDLGDIVKIRLDVEVITSIINTEIEIIMELAVGGFTYSLPFLTESTYTTIGTHRINAYNSIYMGDLNTKDNSAYFSINSNNNCSIKVNGWYCEILRRGY